MSFHNGQKWSKSAFQCIQPTHFLTTSNNFFETSKKLLLLWLSIVTYERGDPDTLEIEFVYSKTSLGRAGNRTPELNSQLTGLPCWVPPRAEYSLIRPFEWSSSSFASHFFCGSSFPSGHSFNIPAGWCRKMISLDDRKWPLVTCLMPWAAWFSS